MAFAVLTNKDKRYQWMQQTFIKFRYQTIVESGLMHRNPLADESERVFTPAGHPPDRQYIQFGQLQRRQCVV